MTITLSKLGLRVDGWADLVEGAGKKSKIALKAVASTMKQRGMAKVEIKSDKAAPNLTSSATRPYVLVEMPNGASVTVYIGQYGSDLYASWDLYVRPKLEIRTILIILGLALALVLPPVLCGWISGLSAADGEFFGGAFAATSCLGGFGFFFNVIFIALLVSIAGLIVKGNLLAFFIKALTQFDGDDIGAMSLGVHKSVLLALDSVGISVTTLRMKEAFTAGGKERLI